MSKPSDSRKKQIQRDRAVDFRSPSWAERMGGLSAAMWTRKDSVRFSNEYERVADMRLWTVRNVCGTPVLACYRPMVDVEAGVVRVDGNCVVEAYDLSLREGQDGALTSASPLACEVANEFVRQLKPGAATSFQVPSAYVGYGSRIPALRTRELAARLETAGVDATADADAVRKCWEQVPRFFRTPTKSQFFLYPAAYASMDAPEGYEHHAVTMEPAPAADAESAAGWALRGGRWVPALPPGVVMFASVGRVAGPATANPAMGVLKEMNIIPRETRQDDAKELEEAVAELRNDERYGPAVRLQLCEMMRERVSRKVHYTPADLLGALLSPARQLVASLHPKVATFADAELSELECRGWSFDFSTPEPAAEAAYADEAGVELVAS